MQASEIREILVQAPEGGVWIFDGDWDEGISADWYAQGRGGFRSRVEGERLVLYYQEEETARWGLAKEEDGLELTLRLPEEYQGSLTVEGGSGDVGLNGVEMTGTLSLAAGSGTVSVYDSEIRGDMTVTAGTRRDIHGGRVPGRDPDGRDGGKRVPAGAGGSDGADRPGRRELGGPDGA